MECCHRSSLSCCWWVTGAVRAMAIRPKWSRPTGPGCDSRSPALSGLAVPWRREASETNASAKPTARVRDPGRAGDATCEMRDGRRLRNPRSCRRHVRASPMDFAQTRAWLFAYSLASRRVTVSFVTAVRGHFRFRLFPCTTSDPRSVSTIGAAVEPACCEGCDFARLSACRLASARRHFARRC
jgi:hypothetical protein